MNGARSTFEVGVLGEPEFGRVIRQPIASEVQHTCSVTCGDVLHPATHQHLGDRDSRGTSTGHDDTHIGQFFADNLEGVRQSGHNNDRCAVLIVVKYRDIKLSDQGFFDFEAFGRRDIFEVDTTEVGGDCLGSVDELLRRRDVQGHGKGVDPGELFEQHRLAFHNRKRGVGADIAEPEDGGPIGHDRNGVPFDRVLPHFVIVLGDRIAHASDAGGVCHRQLVTVHERRLGDHFKLAALMEDERPVGHTLDADVIEIFDRRPDLLGMSLVARIDGDVLFDDAVTGVVDLHIGDVAADICNRLAETGENPRRIHQLHTQG